MSEIVGYVFGALGTVLAVLSYWWGTESERRRHRSAEKAYAKRAHPGEVIIVSNILEPDEENPEKLFLKPRTLVSETDLTTAFPNPALLKRMEEAISRCNPNTPEGSFITLATEEERASLMKRVVNMVSTEGSLGHICRMFGFPIVKNDAYVVLTFSRDGEDRKVRIDFLSGADFRRFSEDPAITTRLRYRPEEGSHDDTAAIFKCAAKKHFEAQGVADPAERRKRQAEAALFVRRVSLPLPLALTTNPEGYAISPKRLH